MKECGRLAIVLVKGWRQLSMVVLWVLSFPLTAMALDYYVATTGDDGNDCLSAPTPCLTVNAAHNKASDGDTVYIASGTYNEYFTIATDLTFIGAGTDSTIIDAGGNGRVLAISSGKTVAIEQLTLQNGVAIQGGGIINQGTSLTLDQVKIQNCQASSTGGGIGNATGSSLTITNSIISGNTSSGSGGGIWNGGTLSVDTVVLASNQGYHGGAVYNPSTGTVNITNSSLNGNTVSNSGEALFNDGGTVTIEKTTISGNTSTNTTDGTVFTSQTGGSVSLVNVTVSSNTAPLIASAQPASPVTFLNSTIANNSGLLRVWDDGAMTFKNTIISGNNNGGNNCMGFFAFYTTSLGNNIEDGNSCDLDDASDQINTDPLIQSLGDYGGPTQTHALQYSSPGVDAGNNTGCPATDQRGVARPIDGDNNATATCDIGAFEFDLVTLSGVSLTGSVTGLTNSLYAFEATSSPADASQPILYTWIADGQSKIVNKSGGITDTVSYVWTSPGVKTVTVTADNGTAQQVETFDITISFGKQAITDVAVSGPTIGSTGQEYVFSASVSPLDATVPLTYTWETEGQTPVVNSKSALADEASFSWDSDGVYTVTLTVASSVNSFSTTYSITTSSWFVDHATGNDTNDCLSWSSPCLTINGAMNKAASGHTIRIASGAYLEKLTIYKNLTFIGAGMETTTIDGEDTRNPVTILPGATVSMKHLTVQNGVANNNGGGIFNNATLTLENVKVANNSAPLAGGGIYNHSTGVLTVRNSIISSNQSSDSGAALANGGGQVTIENSTISGNSGSGGTGADVVQNFSNGSLSMTNVTVSGNTQGEVLSNTLGSTVTALNATIAENSGAVSNEGTMNCKNTIIANNNGGGKNCLNPLTSQGNNLDSSNSCGFSAVGDLVNTSPLLKPLGVYGGPTQTHALYRGSPAVDSGNNIGCPAKDQRGEIRPIDGDKNSTVTCDMGAIESTQEELRSPWILFLPTIIGAAASH